MLSHFTAREARKSKRMHSWLVTHFLKKEEIKGIKNIIPQLHSPDLAHNLALSPLIPVRHSYSGRKKVNKYQKMKQILQED